MTFSSFIQSIHAGLLDYTKAIAVSGPKIWDVPATVSIWCLSTPQPYHRRTQANFVNLENNKK